MARAPAARVARARAPPRQAARARAYTPTGSYSKSITIDHTQVTAALSGFPVMINITSTDLTKALASAADIYFVASDGTTTLPYEIETFTQSTGALLAWVQVASVSDTTDTVVYLRYGDGATHTSPSSVWDSAYFAVWHLNNSLNDSTTGNTHAGSNSGTSDLAAAQIGHGRSFATGNYFDPAGSQVPNSTFYTITTWANFSAFSNDSEIIGASDTSALGSHDGVELAVDSDGSLGFYRSGAFYYGGTHIKVPSTGAWHYIVQRINAASSGGYVEFSVDGSAFTRIYSGDTSSEKATASAGLNIGRWGGGCNGFLQPSCMNGKMDEVRIAIPNSAARADAWHKAEYANQKSSSTFLSFGAEVAPAPKNGAGGGGGGGAQGYPVKNVISSPIWQADTAAATLTGSAPGPFAADDSTWTVKIADLTSMTADWAVASTSAESTLSGGGDTADSPLTLPTPTNAKVTITGGSTASRTSDYDVNVCGADGGKDTVYKFTPSSSGNMRIKVSGGSGTAISRPTVAVYDRYFGNGYFHGCSLQACVTDNDLDTSLPGAQGKSDSDATVGTTTIKDLSVTAGTAYYLVVKSGGSTITNGTFNLELTWKDADDWAGCSEDTYDGKDIWFAFTTAASLASGGTYTIETENSTADTAIALYKDNGDNAYSASEFQTCADEVNGSASITTTLQPSSKYYVRVKQPVGGSSSGNVVVGVRNSSVVQNSDPVAVACSDSASSYGYAKLVETLDPGTYYVGWRGGRGSSHYSGSYHVSFRDNSYLPVAAAQTGCLTLSTGSTNSMEAVLQSGKNYYLLVKGNGTSGNSGSYGVSIVDSGAVANVSCGGTTAAGAAPTRTKRSPSAAPRTSPSTCPARR